MKQKILSIILVCFAVFAHAQSSCVFYGLARINTPYNAVYLSTINTSTGVVSNISTASLSTYVNLTGAALDPYNNNFYFMGANEIKTVNLTSGLTTGSIVISNPIAESYFDNYRFNNSDSSVYGLARRVIYDSVTMTYTTEVYLATINTTTGVITQISTSTLSNGYALAGSAIDPYQKVFYYSTGANFIGVDMYTGGIYSNVGITIPNGIMFDNFTYSCADSSIYGLVRQNYYDTIYDPADPSVYYTEVDSTTIHLAKINPGTGVVSIISPSSLDQGGYSLNSGSTIDPHTMTYYYNNGYELIGVSLVTGMMTTRETLSNVNGQFFELMRIDANCITATIPARQAPWLTNVNDHNNVIGVSISPNPASDYIYINTTSKVNEVIVLNALGQVMIRERAAENMSQINISRLLPGIYTVRISSNENSTTSRFIKQ
jgi:hypothetical protein